MKRLLCVLLAFVMVLSLVACGESGGTPAVTEPDKEIERAISYGIVPEELQGDYGKQITFRQYTELLGNVIALWDENLVEEWESITAAAAASDEEMHREDGLLEMAYALKLVGHTEPDSGYDVTLIDIDTMVDAANADRVNEDMSWEYPLFPTWEEKAFPFFESNYMMGGLFMCATHASMVSDKAIYPYEPNEEENYMQSALTRADAIRAALRFGETDHFVFAKEGDYYHISEVGTYDKTIITDELLNAPTDLPEVTQEKFPTEWKGAGIAHSKNFSGENYTYYREYQESDFVFLAENGFNFSRVFISFSTLRFPDFPEDPRMINEDELKDLDQMIAWGIENGVHIQLLPNYFLDENGNDMTDEIGTGNDMPDSDEEWALFRDYWVMLTKRYKGIPNRYLSFEMMNEIQPRGYGDIVADFDYSVNGIKELVNAIRKEDAERVLLYSYPGNPDMEWAEAMAQLGLSIGCHPYMPAYHTLVHWTYGEEENPYADAAWPQIWWPSEKIGTGQAPLTLQGAVGGLTVSVHVELESHGDLIAYGDGVEIAATFISSPTKDDLFTFTVPEGTEEVEIWTAKNWIKIDTILLEGDFGTTTIIPHDLYDPDDRATPLPLVIREDGTYTNTEDRWITAQEIYDYKIAPLQELAEQYNVGFVCSEFGILPVNMYWDIDMATAYYEEVLAMMREKDIPWCLYTFYDTMPNSIGLMFGHQPLWQGATVGELTYGDTTYRVCQEILDVFRKYTLR